MNKTTLLTVGEVAARLGVSRECVHQWIGEGRIRVTMTLGNGLRLIETQDAVRPKPLRRGRPPLRRS